MLVISILSSFYQNEWESISWSDKSVINIEVWTVEAVERMLCPFHEVIHYK